MVTTTPDRKDGAVSTWSATGRRADPGHDGPAAAAAARVSRAGLLLGGFGLMSAGVVVARLAESWRVGSGVTAHRIAIFGLRLSYPAANAGAIVILVLGVLGCAVTIRALDGAVREFRVARRFARAVALRQPETVDGALVIGDSRPRAFCAGLVRPRIYVSTGAVALLDEEALGAVLAHERHHARRRDPLRLAAGRVLARALFFVPEIGQLVERHQALAELSADESAVGAVAANRSALARAMLSFADAPSAAGAGGIDPVRIDYLLGDPPSWGFPMLVCLAAAGALVLLITVAVLVGQVASGSATLALPFLSRQPCILVLAVIPAALGGVGVTYGRRIRVRLARAAEVLD